MQRCRRAVIAQKSQNDPLAGIHRLRHPAWSRITWCLMVETTGDAPDARIHTKTPGGYSMILDHVGGDGRRVWVGKIRRFLYGVFEDLRSFGTGKGRASKLAPKFFSISGPLDPGLEHAGVTCALDSRHSRGGQKTGQ